MTLSGVLMPYLYSYIYVSIKLFLNVISLALIYLNENARQVNFDDLMHSISHSPTDRTVNESRTIDLKNRLVSIAWKKHSEIYTIRKTIKIL